MKISVSDGHENIELKLATVTQLCGQNIHRKQFVINSLAKYFSNEKYSEAEERYRDNVLVDDEKIGRSYFKVIHISGKEDITSLVKIGKTTLLLQYIKSKLDDFDCASQMVYIEDKLNEILDIINTDIAESIGNIVLDFEPSDLWDMIQKTKAHSVNGGIIELKPTIELLRILVQLIIQNTKDTGDRIIIIIENIDHMLSTFEYKSFVNEMQEYGDIYNNIYTLVTTSLEGYIVACVNTIEGITVFNDVDFNFPDVNRLVSFINDNYPYYRLFEKEDILLYVERIVQKIGKEGYMTEDVEMVISKMINDTLVMPEVRKNKENQAVTAFLHGGSMV